jgi:hypothetical protein
VLAVLAVAGWVLPRRLALWALLGSVVPYVVYAVACAAQGYGGALLSAKTSGIRRALGITVNTGFNRRGAPSLGGTLASQAATFVGSYLVVVVGTVCGLALLRSRRPEHRLLGAITAGAAVLLGYSVLFGTIEEQFLYFLAVPAIVATAVGFPQLLGRVLAGIRLHRRRDARSHSRPARVGVVSAGRRAAALSAAAIAMVLAWNSAAWAVGRADAVNEVQQVSSWMRTNVAPGSTIAYAEGVVQFAVQTEGFRAVPLSFPRSMVAAGVRYFVTIPQEIQDNYSFVSPQSYRYFTNHGHVVYRTSSTATAGSIVVIETDDPSVW